MNTDTDQLIANINTELESKADSSYRELVRDRYNMNVDNFTRNRHHKTIAAIRK